MFEGRLDSQHKSSEVRKKSGSYKLLKCTSARSPIVFGLDDFKVLEELSKEELRQMLYYAHFEPWRHAD